jgi:hypothetical protein
MANSPCLNVQLAKNLSLPLYNSMAMPTRSEGWATFYNNIMLLLFYFPAGYHDRVSSDGKNCFGQYGKINNCHFSHFNKKSLPFCQFLINLD